MLHTLLASSESSHTDELAQYGPQSHPDSYN